MATYMAQMVAAAVVAAANASAATSSTQVAQVLQQGQATENNKVINQARQAIVDDVKDNTIQLMIVPSRDHRAQIVGLLKFVKSLTTQVMINMFTGEDVRTLLRKLVPARAADVINTAPVEDFMPRLAQPDAELPTTAVPRIVFKLFNDKTLQYEMSLLLGDLASRTSSLMFYEDMLVIAEATHATRIQVLSAYAATCIPDTHNARWQFFEGDTSDAAVRKYSQRPQWTPLSIKSSESKTKPYMSRSSRRALAEKNTPHIVGALYTLKPSSKCDIDIQIETRDGQFVPARAACDTKADINCISLALAKRAGLAMKHSFMTLFGMAGNMETVSPGLVTFKIHTANHAVFEIEARCIPNLRADIILGEGTLHELDTQIHLHRAGSTSIQIDPLPAPSSPPAATTTSATTPLAAITSGADVMATAAIVTHVDGMMNNIEWHHFGAEWQTAALKNQMRAILQPLVDADQTISKKSGTGRKYPMANMCEPHRMPLAPNADGQNMFQTASRRRPDDERLLDSEYANLINDDMCTPSTRPCQRTCRSSRS